MLRSARNSRLRVWLLSLATAAAAAASLSTGCGGGEDLADAGEGADAEALAPIAAQAYCAARAAAACSAQVRCGNVPAEQATRCRDLYTGRPPPWDVRAPGTAQASFCIGDLLASLIGDSQAVYDPQAAAECVAAIRDSACDRPLTHPVEPEACTRVLKGALTTGASCVQDVECQSGFCRQEGATCPGTCAERTTQSCRGNARCTEDRYCTNDGDASYCRPRPAHGERCGETRECEPGFVCEHHLEALDGGILGGGRCMPEERLASGERCLNTTNLEPAKACGDGLYCDVDGVCSPIGGPGAICANQQGWWVGPCQDLTRCIAGACTVLPGPGEACADTKCPAPPAVCEANASTLCLSGSKCSGELSGTCESFYVECAGGCRSGICESSANTCLDCRRRTYDVRSLEK